MNIQEPLSKIGITVERAWCVCSMARSRSITFCFFKTSLESERSNCERLQRRVNICITLSAHPPHGAPSSAWWRGSHHIVTETTSPYRYLESWCTHLDREELEEPPVVERRRFSCRKCPLHSNKNSFTHELPADERRRTTSSGNRG